jgi:hypothetical protein
VFSLVVLMLNMPRISILLLNGSLMFFSNQLLNFLTDFFSASIILVKFLSDET